MMNTFYLQAVDLCYTSATVLEECQRTCAETAQIVQQSRRLQASLQTRQQCYVVTICAWCHSRMRVETTALPPPFNENHSICQSCCAQLEAELELSEDAHKAA